MGVVSPPPPPPHHKGSPGGEESTKAGSDDYDIPRSSKDRASYGDYDFPRGQNVQDVPQPQAGGSPLQHQLSGETLKDVDHDLTPSKEERLRKEKVSSMLAHKTRRSSESSSDASRPVSVTSSAYSADASSASLNSSRSSSKMTLPKDDEYEQSRSRASGLISQSSFEQQLEMIDQLVDDIAEQNSSKKKQSDESTGSGDGFELPTLGKVLSARSSNSEASSNSGSQDNLGVWDDVNYEEEDSDDLEGTYT